MSIDTVVLISLDCVRREALGCYPVRFSNALEPWTPNVDRLARSGVRFDQAITQAPYTPAAHASVFTGLNPYHHGIRAIIGYRLAAGALPLAERLHTHGFATAAFIGSHALSRGYGLDRGFEVYDDQFAEATPNWVLGSRRPCEESTDRALAWLEGHPGPALLFLHYFDAHDLAGDPMTAQPLHQITQMARIDVQIGRLLRFLDRTGRTERTLFVVFADHGDAFGEHREYNHREYLYDTTLRIPLILSGGIYTGGRVISSQVRAIDLLPTVLEALDLPPDPPMDGESLSPLLTMSVDRPAYAETCYEVSPEDWSRLKTSFAALRQDSWKVILNRLTDECELYDLVADPGERRNLASVQPSLCDALAAKVKALSETPPLTAKVMALGEMAAVVKRLRDLGYVEGF